MDPDTTIYETAGTLNFESGDYVPSTLAPSDRQYRIDGSLVGNLPSVTYHTVNGTQKTWSAYWSDTHLPSAHNVAVVISVDDSQQLNTYDLETSSTSLNCG